MRKLKSWTWHQRDITDEERAQYPAVRDIDRAYYNDFYSVQVYKVPTDLGQVLHLIVRGQINNQEPGWRDMQRIKDELIGTEYEAVQVYPKQADIVDQADVYDLWVLPIDRSLPFGLHRENGLRKDRP